MNVSRGINVSLNLFTNKKTQTYKLIRVLNEQSLRENHFFLKYSMSAKLINVNFVQV